MAEKGTGRRGLRWSVAAALTVTAVFVLSNAPTPLYPSVLAGPLAVVDPLAAGAIACAMFLVATCVQFVAGGLSTRTHVTLSSAAAIAGYLPAGTLPVATGYLADASGLTSAVVAFAAIIAACALLALPVVRVSTRRHLRGTTEPARRSTAELA